MPGRPWLLQKCSNRIVMISREISRGVIHTEWTIREITRNNSNTLPFFVRVRLLLYRLVKCALITLEHAFVCVLEMNQFEETISTRLPSCLDYGAQ